MRAAWVPWIVAAGLASALTHCQGSKEPTTAAAPAAEPAPLAVSTAPPVQNTPYSAELTKALFSSIARKEVGDEQGRVELREGLGILIHPGVTTPTTVTFALDGKHRQLGLRFFVVLDEEGSKVPEAGTAHVKALLDGKPVFESDVDRRTASENVFDVSSARELTLQVDNQNGKAWWDWFFVSVQSAE
jgi:hypothetical protein